MINLFIKQLLLKVGEEPDPRFTLANERTFLAWTRTALALLASAVALITISEHYHQLQKAQQIFNVLVIASLIISSSALLRWYREPYRVCRRLSILRECSDDQIKIYP
ncbi:DUF202 domain-containing protein [Acinetobacter baumannii]|uniref:DUF202 domain-containing protein n=1 Tax=Acinetobacter baumannii TaxID=470 RepID=UPI000A589579